MARKSVVENNLEGSHMRSEDLGARSGSGGSPRDQPGGMDKAFLPRHPWAGVSVDIPVSRIIVEVVVVVKSIRLLVIPDDSDAGTVVLWSSSTPSRSLTAVVSLEGDQARFGCVGISSVSESAHPNSDLGLHLDWSSRKRSLQCTVVPLRLDLDIFVLILARQLS